MTALMVLNSGWVGLYTKMPWLFWVCCEADAGP